MAFHSAISGPGVLHSRNTNINPQILIIKLKLPSSMYGKLFDSELFMGLIGTNKTGI